MGHSSLIIMLSMDYQLEILAEKITRRGIFFKLFYIFCFSEQKILCLLLEEKDTVLQFKQWSTLPKTCWQKRNKLDGMSVGNVIDIVYWFTFLLAFIIPARKPGLLNACMLHYWSSAQNETNVCVELMEVLFALIAKRKYYRKVLVRNCRRVFIPGWVAIWKKSIDLLLGSYHQNKYSLCLPPLQWLYEGWTVSVKFNLNHWKVFFFVRYLGFQPHQNWLLSSATLIKWSYCSSWWWWWWWSLLLLLILFLEVHVAAQIEPSG